MLSIPPILTFIVSSHLLNMPFPSDLRIKQSLGQAQGTISKSVAQSSRYIARKIQSGLEILSFNGPNPPQVIPPHTFPRLNATYCLMDVDYLRPQGPRPWAAPYSLQVMNPDPDYLDEEYVQVGPSPSDFDVRQPLCPEDVPSGCLPSINFDEEPLPDLPESPESPSGSPSEADGEDAFWKEVELFIDERNKYDLPSVSGTDWGRQSPVSLFEPPQTSCCCLTGQGDKELTLSEDAGSEGEALLAVVIRAGLMSQYRRRKLL